MHIPKDLIHVYMCTCCVLFLIHVVHSVTEFDGSDCPPFDGSKIRIDGKCQCNTIKGCYQLRMGFFCIRMKECPPGYEPNQATNECLPCKPGFFSATSDCMPCIPFTKCKQYELLDENRLRDTLCGQKEDMTTQYQTKSSSTTQETTKVIPDMRIFTKDMIISEKTERTTPQPQKPPKNHQDPENITIVFYISGIISVFAIVVVLFTKKIRNQENGREKHEGDIKNGAKTDKPREETTDRNGTDNDEPTENISLVSDRSDSRMSDPPPYAPRGSPPKYNMLHPTDSLHRCSSQTYLKREVTSGDLSYAPTLDFNPFESSIEAVRIPPNEHVELTKGYSIQEHEN